jgi:hypothetical protein
MRRALRCGNLEAMPPRKTIRPGAALTSPVPGGPQDDRPILTGWRLTTRRQRADYDQKIAARVVEIGEEPFRFRDPLDDEPPHPRHRWIFPSIAHSRGGDYSRDFMRSIEGVDPTNLRFVTLRFGPAKPARGELAAHVAGLSHAINRVVSYLAHIGLAQPQVSAVHIRYDVASARLDPHLHGIWRIPSGRIADVEKLLSKHFSGVWIDEGPIRSLSSLAFYICSRIFDHEAVPDWPRAAIAEAWALMGRAHFVRPAGLFAAWIRRRRAADGPATPPKATRKPTGGPNRDRPASGSGRTVSGAQEAKFRASVAIATVEPPAPTHAAALTSPAGPAVPEIHDEAATTVGTLPLAAVDFNEVMALLIDLAKSQR